jgi:hypothetical protein
LKKEAHYSARYLYKEKEKWKHYLVKRIMEIAEKKHDEVVKLLHSL